MCSLWCHKECARISEEFFKSLEIQKKEMGIAYWACRSCVSFATKMNAKFKEVDKRMDELTTKVDENAEELEQAQQKIEKVEKNVGHVEKKVDNMEKRMEDKMYEEMRAREAIRRNLVIYGVEEQNKDTDKERMEADLAECERIFSATGTRAGKRDIRFCRRIGEKEKSKGKRPILVGMKAEALKIEILDAAKELQNTRFKHISIGPDQTRKQRQAEMDLTKEADRKNRDELTAEDRSKNLKWMAVGRKGEKRIVKAPVREERGAASGSNRGWRTERREDQDDRGRHHGNRRQERRDREEDDLRMETETEDQLSKRGRESGSETEENPPRTRSKH
jgi:hypothetical protein